MFEEHLDTYQHPVHHNSMGRPCKIRPKSDLLITLSTNDNGRSNWQVRVKGISRAYTSCRRLAPHCRSRIVSTDPSSQKVCVYII